VGVPGWAPAVVVVEWVVSTVGVECEAVVVVKVEGNLEEGTWWWARPWSLEWKERCCVLGTRKREEVKVSCARCGNAA